MGGGGRAEAAGGALEEGEGEAGGKVEEGEAGGKVEEGGGGPRVVVEEAVDGVRRREAEGVDGVRRRGAEGVDGVRRKGVEGVDGVRKRGEEGVDGVPQTVEEAAGDPRTVEEAAGDPPRVAPGVDGGPQAVDVAVDGVPVPVEGNLTEMEALRAGENPLKAEMLGGGRPVKEVDRVETPDGVNQRKEVPPKAPRDGENLPRQAVVRVDQRVGGSLLRARAEHLRAVDGGNPALQLLQEGGDVDKS